MAQRYYINVTGNPPIVRAILQRVNIHIAQLLYSDEAERSIEDTIESRIFVTDIDAGGDNALGDASRFFGAINAPFPFTAYGVGDREVIIEKTTFAASGGFIFVPNLGYAKAVPVNLFIPAFSFFSNPDDWNLAFSNLIMDNSSLTKVDVPIKFKNIDTNIRCTLSYDTISKGSFAGAFAEHLRSNEIWDIQHNFKISYTELVFVGSAIDDPNKPKIVLNALSQPVWGIVDNMYLRLYNNYTQELIDEIQIPGPPTVSSVIPADKDTGVSTNASITVSFSKPMIQESVENAFEILPFVEGNFAWDMPGQTVTFIPHNPLNNNTNYIVTINKSAKDGNEVKMEEDFIFSFKTA